MSWSRFFAMVQKEFRQFTRDRRTLLIAFALPMVLLVGIGGTLEERNVQHLSIAIANEDANRSFSWHVVDEFENSKVLQVSMYVNSIYDGQKAVEARRVWAVIVIPRGFSDAVQKGGRAPLIALVDNSVSSIYEAILPEVHAITGKLSQRYSILLKVQTSQVGIQVEDTSIPIFRAFSRLAIFAPMVVGLSIQQTALVLTTVSVTREKERRTFEQIIVTPVTTGEFLLSKFLTYFLVSIVIGAASYAVLFFGFDLPMYGNLLDIAILTTLFTIVQLGLGLVIAVVSKNQMQAILVGSFLLLPSMIFSGITIPPELVPSSFRLIIYVQPLFHYARSMTQILLGEKALTDVLSAVLVLLAFIAGTFGISMRAFSKKFD